MVIMDPTQEGGPHVITATAGNLTLTLNDVLFGDVWICSGESNMQFTVYSVRNTYTHNQQVNMFYVTVGVQCYRRNSCLCQLPEIRVFTASLNYSTIPEIDLLGIEEMWSVAGPSDCNNAQISYIPTE